MYATARLAAILARIKTIKVCYRKQIANKRGLAILKLLLVHVIKHVAKFFWNDLPRQVFVWRWDTCTATAQKVQTLLNIQQYFIIINNDSSGDIVNLLTIQHYFIIIYKDSSVNIARHCYESN